MTVTDPPRTSPGEVRFRTERFDDPVLGLSVRTFIDHADPVIWITGPLLRNGIIAAGDHPFAVWRGCCPCGDNRCPVNPLGGTVKIFGANRMVLYRITGHDAINDRYSAEWPD